VNAWRAGAPFHLRDWLEQQLNSSGPVGLPWTSTLAFLRLVTKPRVFENPEPIGDAWQPANTWLACETAWIPQRRGELLGEFLALPAVHGNLVPDAHLPALAVEHGLPFAPRTVILRGFAVYVGLIPSRPEDKGWRERVPCCQPAPQARSDMFSIMPSRHECHVRSTTRPAERGSM
jgi:uncharacterized protein